MTNLPFLTLLWAIPVVGAAVIIVLPASARQFAKYAGLVVALAVLVVSLVLAVRFDPAGEQFQFVENHPWIPSFGTGYILGVDGIALALVVLTAVLVPLLLIAGWHDADDRPGLAGRGPHSYIALTLAVEGMVLMSLAALDILLFYVFFEAMLIPMYFLIGGFGNENRSKAAVKFLLYNLFGGLVMLAAVIGLYVVTSTSTAFDAGTFDFRAITEAVATGTFTLQPGIANALFLGFMFAFAVKAPLWPFHRWLPGAAVQATPASAVLMMAVMDKVGTFGMLRYCLPLFPDSATYFRPVIITLAVIGIVYGAILAIGQTDVMRLIAYTSISHFGFIILGIFVMTSQGQSGSTLYMVNHGISTAALFLIAGFLVSRRGTRVIAAYGGVQKVAPVLAGTFLISGLATLSLPGLAPFISEFLVLIGTFTRYPVLAVCATIALVLSALYVLWMYQRMMTGPVTEGNETMQDLRPRELVVVAPLIALLIALGVYPKIALDVINPAVTATLTSIHQPDPTPTAAQGARPMNPPSIAYGQLAPMLIVFGAAVAGVLIEAFAPRKARYRTQLTLSLAALFVALIWVLRITLQLRGGLGTSTVAGAVDIEMHRPTLFLQGTILLIGVLSVLLIAERRAPAESPDGAVALDAFTADASTVPGSVAEKVATKAALIQTEVFPLTMFAIGGMMLFGAAGDFLTMFIALEVLSLPLYLMCGLARRRRLLSQEAALKYFLLGAFSSAFFLYGIGLLYGFAGTMSLTGIAEAIQSKPDNTTLALLGSALVAVGLLFKVGAVPFHSWVPDVYQGAPTPITGFMAAATKVAAFGAMLRVFYVALPGLSQGWRPVLWVVAILTMVIGTVTAVTQTDVKRMLAYSAVAHAGFILTGVIAGNQPGLSATLFYLFAYAFSTLGAFAVVSVVRDANGAEETSMARWAGLGRRYPLVGVVFSLFLLAFAGIPLTSGFVSKFAVFKAAGQGGAIPLVIVGVLASAIAAYFYVRVIVLMFFTDPPEDAPEVVTPSALSVATITLTAAITFALGALPQPLLDLADNAARFLP